METIVLSDDEEAAPRTGLCIHCGQVSKPHACPHGTVKIMKPLSKSKCHPAKKQRTSAAAAEAKMHAALFGSDSEDDEDDAPRPPPPTPAPAMPSTSASTGGSAHNMLSTLLSEHSQQQSKIAQQQLDLASSQARETAANAAVAHAPGV